MAIDFPNSPSVNATYTVGNRTWIYDGTSWNTYNTTSFSAETLPGTNLKSTVTGSSLTSVGTLGSLTVTGDVTVDTNTLYVDSTNNRVGIGTASPSFQLDTTGTARLGGITTDGSLMATNTVTFNPANNAFNLNANYGTIGIGTSADSTPTTRLTISGNTNVTGTITARTGSSTDGVALAGRAGGTSSYEVTLQPTTLTADRTITLPDSSGTLAYISSIETDGIGYEPNVYYTGRASGLSNSVAFTTNTAYYVPFFVTKTTTFNRIAVRGGASMTGTSTVRLGIYTNSNGKPTTVLNDYGTVSVSVNTTGEITISKSLERGWYWLVAVAQTSTGNNAFQACNPVLPAHNTRVASSFTPVMYSGWSQTGVTGALATAGTLSESNQPVAVMLRAA